MSTVVTFKSSKFNANRTTSGVVTRETETTYSMWLMNGKSRKTLNKADMEIISIYKDGKYI